MKLAVRKLERFGLAVALVMVPPSLAFAKGGQGAGNGGQLTASQAAKRLSYLNELMKEKNIESLSGAEAERFRDQFKSPEELKREGKASSSPKFIGCPGKVYLNTEDPCAKKKSERRASVRDAANFPATRTIYYSIPEWSGKTWDELDPLLIHEDFGLLEIEKSGEFFRSNALAVELKPLIEADEEKKAKAAFLASSVENSAWPLTTELRNLYTRDQGALLRSIAIESILALVPENFTEDSDRQLLQNVLAAGPSLFPSSRVAIAAATSPANNLPDLIVSTILNSVPMAASTKWTSRLEWKDALEEIVRKRLVEDAIRATVSGSSTVVGPQSQALDPSNNPYLEALGGESGMLSTARMPTPADLKIGEAWYCLSIAALPGLDLGDRIGSPSGRAITKSLPWYRFVPSEDGFYRNTGLSQIPALVSLEKYTALGGTKDFDVVDYVRVLPSGSLIGETSVSVNSSLYSESGSKSSINPRRMVVAHHMCASGERKTSSPTLAAMDVLRQTGWNGFHRYMENRTVGLCRYRVIETKTTEDIGGSQWGGGDFGGPTKARRMRADYRNTSYEILVGGVTRSWDYFADKQMLRKWKQSYINGRSVLPDSAYADDNIMSAAESVRPDGLSGTALKNAKDLAYLLASGVCEVDPNDREAFQENRSGK